jgi:AraC-like DNA-binding protein
MASFSTRGLPAARKVSYWNEITSESFAQMEIQPRDATRFDGTLSREPLGPLTLMEVFSTAVHVRHTRAHIAKMSAPSYLLLAPLQREFELTLEHLPGIRVRAGEFCLIDHARPYDLIHGDGVRTLCLDVPRHSLEERIPEAARLVGQLMRPESSMSRMLAGLLRDLGNEAHASGVANLPPAFGHSLLSFVAATYSSCIEAPVGRGVGAKAKAYRAYIDARLTESELKPSDVALRFGISERYLRSVLSADGESFSAYLLRRRLERCARHLKSDGEQRTITEIAFDSGFINPTHFGQAFKARYGCAPKMFRRS